MADDILQRFLAKRLFDVAGDDTRLGHLRTAADDVGALLKASPERTAAFTMVAIDPEVSPDEPILAEVGAILQRPWNSYKGAFSDEKLPVVFRGIILTALEKIIGSEPIAASVTLTCRNLLPRLGGPADSDLWATLIDSASRKLELRARREWSLPSASSFQQAELILPDTGKIAPATANISWLEERLQKAAGPHNTSNENTGGNAYWPSQNEHWVTEFGTRAANAIAGSVNGVIKRLVEALNEQSGAAAQTEAISSYIRTVAEGVTQTTLGLERRTSLIWWKEALYSPSAERSYRDFDLPAAAALAAFDANNQTGPFAPRMAEAFFLETLRMISPDGCSTPIPLTELCARATAPHPDDGDLVQHHFAALHREAGRTPLASLLGAGEAIDGKAIEQRIGLPADLRMSSSEFALWLYRDLQASAATPPKKKKGK